METSQQINEAADRGPKTTTAPDRIKVFYDRLLAKEEVYITSGRVGVYVDGRFAYFLPPGRPWKGFTSWELEELNELLEAALALVRSR